MGRFGITEILILLGIALLLFGGSRIANIGKGLGEGIKNFKKGIKEGDDEAAPKLAEGEEKPSEKLTGGAAASTAASEKLSSEKT
jgi:sec-independent protein translocase protein TatA